MGGGAGCPLSVRMVLVDVDSSEILIMVGRGICSVETVVELLEVTRLWESGSMSGLGGIRFGCTVSRVALDVCASAHRDGVQSIVDVSFGIFRGRIFELSFIAVIEAKIFLSVEFVLLLLLLVFSLSSNSEFANILFAALLFLFLFLFS